MFTQSHGFSKEFIGVISAGIGDITNQNDEITPMNSFENPWD